MEEITEESAQLVERVCAIDIGKADLVACVRVPHATRPGRRVQEVREYATVTPVLLQLADWLRVEQVELVAMEATSDYWKPVFYLLEAEGFQCWLLNAQHVKNVPGRPKTDLLTELWGGSVGSVRQLRVGGVTFPGHDRREGRCAGSVPVGGRAVRVA
jgi:transposase